MFPEERDWDHVFLDYFYESGFVCCLRCLDVLRRFFTVLHDYIVSL